MGSPDDANLLSFLTSIADLQSVLYSVLVSTLALWLLVRKPIGIPPGPRWRTPILGNLREFTSHYGLKSTLKGLRHTYGDVYSLFLCRRLVVIVSGKKSIDRLIKKDEKTLEKIDLFDEMTVLASRTLGQSKNPSLLFRAIEAVFDDCGTLEDKIDQTAGHLIEAIAQHTDRAVDPIDIISNTASELVIGILFDKSSKEDASTIEKLSPINKELSCLRGDEIMMKLVPTLKYFPSERIRCRKLKKLRDQIDQIFKHSIEDGKSEFEWGDGVLSTYYRLAQKEIPDNKTKDSEACKILVSLYLSVTRSITTMVYSAVSFLMKHQNIQEEIRIEALKMVGGTRGPAIEDITKLTSLRSFILETKRFVRVNSLLGYPRLTTDETRLLGYDIPKNTLVLADIESLMTDPSVWIDPLEFKPSRFLTDEEMVSIIAKKVQYLKEDSTEWAVKLTDTTAAILISKIILNFIVSKPEDNLSEHISNNRYTACFVTRNNA